MLDIDIDSFKKQYLKIEKEIDKIDYSNWEKIKPFLRKKKLLERIIEKDKEKKEIEREIRKNKQSLKQEKDEEFIELFQQENKTLKLKLDKKSKSLQLSVNLLTDDRDEDQDYLKGTALIEIRAGVGGEEANLFVKDLFQMYSKYCEQKKWKIDLLSLNKTEINGYKEIIFEVLDKNSYKVFKNEAGVHRVQRVPVTEKNNRVHTSTVSVIVLPKIKNTKIEIKPEDIRIDVYCASGPGGQNVNKRETAVRLVHISTGIVVTCQMERTQKNNKEKALDILKSKIFLFRKEQENIKKKEIKRTQVRTSDRSEKKRTYNFPQNRLTDHHLGKTWNNLREIMNGNMDILF